MDSNKKNKDSTKPEKDNQRGSIEFSTNRQSIISDEKNKEEKYILEEMRYQDAKLGICSVCRHSLINNDCAGFGDFDKALLCSNGHLLCQNCIRKYRIKSDTNCVLCATTEKKMFKGQQTVKNNNSDATPLEINISSSDLLDNNSTSTKYGSTDDDTIDWEDDEETAVETEDGFYPSQRFTAYCNNNSSSSYSRSLGQLPIKATNKINWHVMSEFSRRPIQCPSLDCAVNVAFSALTNHFIYDHPDVPILSINPKEKTTFIVNFDGLAYDSSRCLALLLVSDKLSQFSVTSVNQRLRNRLPLPLLAARVLSSNVKSKQEVGEPSITEDLVICWLAGLDFGNSTGSALICSIQATDTNDFRSLTFTGPINSLRTAQKHQSVLSNADCLILRSGYIKNIASNCGNVNVNVIVH